MSGLCGNSTKCHGGFQHSAFSVGEACNYCSVCTSSHNGYFQSVFVEFSPQSQWIFFGSMVVAKPLKDVKLLHFLTSMPTSLISRYIDDINMDVVAVYNANASADSSALYNCDPVAPVCALPLFDPSNKSSEASNVVVDWTYGTQNFELRCISKHNLKVQALRRIIAWPLLMSVVVTFFYILVYLVLKRMLAIEKDVALIEKMNIDLKDAKIASEAADKAKSNFLATISHEIRQ